MADPERPRTRARAAAVRAGQAGPRERILRASGALFGAEGIRAVGVDRLIARAGVAKATFYRHFPSKDALVVAWLGTSDARWIDSVREEIQRRTDGPAQCLASLFDVLGEWFADSGFNGCPFLNCASEIRDPDHPASRKVRAYFDELEAWLRGLLDDAGVPRAEELSVGVRLLVVGAITTALATSSSTPAADARAVLLQLLAATPRARGAALEQIAKTTAGARSKKARGGARRS